MAFALVTHDKAGSANQATAVVSGLTTTGATWLVGIVSDFGVNAASVVTDNKGSGWASGTSYQVSANRERCTIWYRKATAADVGASHTFTATGTATFPSLFVLAFSGSGKVVLDVENGAATAAATTLATGSVSPAMDNSLIVAGFCASAGTPASVDSSFTLEDVVTTDGVNDESGASAFLIQTAKGAVNPIFTNSGSARLAAAIAVFKVTSGGNMLEVF